MDEATRSPFLWLSQGAPHFFMLFLSVSWPWVVVKYHAAHRMQPPTPFHTSDR